MNCVLNVYTQSPGMRKARQSKLLLEGILLKPNSKLCSLPPPFLPCTPHWHFFFFLIYYCLFRHPQAGSMALWCCRGFFLLASPQGWPVLIGAESSTVGDVCATQWMQGSRETSLHSRYVLASPCWPRLCSAWGTEDILWQRRGTVGDSRLQPELEDVFSGKKISPELGFTWLMCQMSLWIVTPFSDKRFLGLPTFIFRIPSRCSTGKHLGGL